MTRLVPSIGRCYGKAQIRKAQIRLSVKISLISVISVQIIISQFN